MTFETTFVSGLFVLLCINIVTISTYRLAFVSSHGLNVLSTVQINAQLYEIVVSSNEVFGEKKIRILLPPDYLTTGTNRHYPTLYLLHGAYGSASDWITRGAAQEICGKSSLITVMPSADSFSFYTNWILPGDRAPQNWRTFHMEQIVPWIDFNLRTVDKKEGRAICGLSMGGFGAINYASQYSHNFIYAASFSGVLDLLDLDVRNIMFNIMGNDERLFFGPFGQPSEPINVTAWFFENPLTRVTSMKNVSVAIYTGSSGTWESIFRRGSYRLRDQLVLSNITVHFNDYVDGQSIGHGCVGDHDWTCWKGALIDVLPRMLAVLHQGTD